MNLQETMTIFLSHGEAGSPAEAVEIPRRIGNARIGGVLGEGAGGVVLSGFDEAIRRRVAVKLLHRSHGALSDAAWNELAAGLRAAARVKHPNIVTIHSVENVNSTPAIIMEYVDGVSLRELLRRAGRLDLSLALHIAGAIVSAVAALHDAGVVHRDLKPANILLDRDGAVHVCDFGLACDVHGNTPSRQSPAAGSPLYMAPEAFDGEIAPPSDVYAVGIMLFEMLTGHPPFVADTLSEIRAIQSAAEPPLNQLDECGVPASLRDIVERALHKQRYLRYKSAGHLDRALAGISVPERRREILAGRIASLVNAEAGPVPPMLPERTPSFARTTFDLVAERARRKREARE